MNKLLAFGWYGGKFSHLNWLLPLLPYTNHFVDVYAASASVLLNREPSPLETLNDIDEEIITFFDILRTHTEELIRAIDLTPYSRQEFKRSLDPQNQDKLERARLFYIKARQARLALTQRATGGRWQYCTAQSRRGIAGTVSKWLGGKAHLEAIAKRLLLVQLENDPAIDVIKRYDTKETLFYCDPPYPHEIRGDSNVYQYEMTEEDHRELAEILHNVEGLVAISGYDCSIMQELYGDWRVFKAPIKKTATSFEDRQETLWTNYNPTKRFRRRGVLDLFLTKHNPSQKRKGLDQWVQ